MKARLVDRAMEVPETVAGALIVIGMVALTIVALVLVDAYRTMTEERPWE